MASWERYFAFGSNMSTARLRSRIPLATPLGAGRLPGWRFACDKSGMDGSAKANIRPAEDGEVWGVVYRLPVAALPELDRIEGGYQRRLVEVVDRTGRPLSCHTYFSSRLTDDSTVFDWYKDHILHGANEHDLPPSWRKMLEALPARSR